MSAVDLQDPILDSSGIRSINFFNGRLLTARDLTREQAANREVDGRLGQGIGDGIAYGLEVAKSRDATNQAPLVYVTSGLAVNRRGQTLRLVNDTDVELVRQPDSSAASKPFTECLPLQSGTYVAGAGMYLLTMAPAQTNEGRAPTNGLDTPAVSCNTDATVTTVQFRLIQLDPPITEAELDDEDHLRNLIAYKCFGVTEQQAHVKDLFGAELKKYGLLDSLRPSRLTDCDVPLAVLYWTLSGGIKFLDNWSVRRRLIHHLISGRYAPYLDETSTRASEAMVFASRLSPYVDERRAGEGQAMLLQFEEQLYALVSSLANPQNFVATEAFGLLPPAGIVPLRNAAYPRGFTYENFFQDKRFAQPTPISAAKLGDLLTESLRYPPINLGGTEHVQLYEVIENKQAQTGPTPPQPYVVFASAELPYYSEKPRFGSMCQTLRETGLAYRSLNHRDLFFNSESTGPALAARLSVRGAIQAAITASSEAYAAACGCGCSTTHDKGLSVLANLYEVQTHLLAVLNTDRPGVAPGLAARFAELLGNYLNVGIPFTPTPKPALGAAINSRNLGTAVEAQDAINHEVFSFAGVSVSGNVRVTYVTSTLGRNLVRGNPGPFNYTFRVENLSNQTLSLRLQPSFDPHPDWGPNASVVPDSLTLNPFNASTPTDPTTFSVVTVTVTPPLAAALGDTARLILTATATGAAGLSHSADVALTISDHLESEPTDTVEFRGTPSHDISETNVPTTGLGITYTFTCRYHTTRAGGPPRQYRLNVINTIGTVANYVFAFFDLDDESNITEGPLTTIPFTMNNDLNKQLRVNIRPQSAAHGTSLTFTLRIVAVDDNTLDAESGPFTISAA